MKQIYIGKITNTFGIKGQLKIHSSFERLKDVLFISNKIIIDKKEYTISDVLYHKKTYIIRLDNINDINEVLFLKNKEIYINKENIPLKEGEYLFEELLLKEVICNNKKYGKVTEVLYGINPLIKVDNKFYIPINDEYIKKVTEEEIITEGIEGLIL